MSVAVCFMVDITLSVNVRSEATRVAVERININNYLRINSHSYS